MTEQRTHGGALASHLVKLGFINEDALLSYLQKEYRLPVVDPSNLDIPPEVLGLVPAAMTQKHHFIPVSLVRSTLTIAMSDPSNIVAINEVKFLTGYDVKVAVAGVTGHPARARALLRRARRQLRPGAQRVRRARTSSSSRARRRSTSRSSSAPPRKRRSSAWSTRS